MTNIFDLDRLCAIDKEAAWKEAYEEELHKLDESFRLVTLLEYEAITRNQEDARLEELQKQHFALFSDPRFAQVLGKWEQLLADGTWKRRLKVLQNAAREKEIENHPTVAALKNKLQTHLTNQKFTHQGESYPFSSVQSHLMANADRDLRKALFDQVNHAAVEMEEEFRALIKARNELARQKGYPTYHRYLFEGIMQLDFELYRAEGFQMMEATRAISREWSQRFQEKWGYAGTQYYDAFYAALNFLEIPRSLFPQDRIKEALHFTCRHFGLEPERMPLQIELLDIPFGGMMNAIATDDLRIVLKKQDGFSRYGVALHELGHALYEFFSAQQPPELFRFKNIIGHEAMAEIVMTIASQKEWLRDFLGMEEAVLAQTAEAEHLFSLTLTKFYFYQSMVEHVLYENPDGDLQAMADRMFQEIFGGDSVGLHPAAEMMFLAYPVYVQDYIYADGVRDMIREHFAISGLYGQAEVFAAIRNVFMEPSEAQTWQEKVEKLCGKRFSLQAFAQFLAKEKSF
ncbi:hypothetical protein ACTID9_27950 [Brevibacillus fluminis]|uniref:hypothetical protein n=1 Tax=Brevibacillus fluminis TaxID=511487 RepID=UPI003F8CCA0F